MGTRYTGTNNNRPPRRKYWPMRLYVPPHLRFVPVNQKESIKNLVEDYPNGLPLESFKTAYYDKYSAEFKSEDFGFSDLKRCISSLKDVCQVEINNYGKDVLKPLGNAPMPISFRPEECRFSESKKCISLSEDIVRANNLGKDVEKPCAILHNGKPFHTEEYEFSEFNKGFSSSKDIVNDHDDTTVPVELDDGHGSNNQYVYCIQDGLVQQNLAQHSSDYETGQRLLFEYNPFPLDLKFGINNGQPLESTEENTNLSTIESESEVTLVKNICQDSCNEKITKCIQVITFNNRKIHLIKFKGEVFLTAGDLSRIMGGTDVYKNALKKQHMKQFSIVVEKAAAKELFFRLEKCDVNLLDDDMSVQLFSLDNVKKILKMINRNHLICKLEEMEKGLSTCFKNGGGYSTIDAESALKEMDLDFGLKMRINTLKEQQQMFAVMKKQFV